jgi:hypothetical protein
MTAWGIAHLVPAGWDPDADDADDPIEATCDFMRSHLAVAEELWTLVAPERAQHLDALVLHAYSRKPPVLNPDEVSELGRALDGLEASLRDAGWIDANGDVPADRIPEVRRRTKTLELGENRVASAAISSGLWRVDVARAFIAKCIAGGYSMMFE